MHKIHQRNTKLKRRSKIQGTKERPRISVNVSNQYIYAQLVDDNKSHTLAYSKGKKADEVAQDLAKQMKKLKITRAVYDRGNKKYHGNVAKLADTLRNEGINI